MRLRSPLCISLGIGFVLLLATSCLLRKKPQPDKLPVIQPDTIAKPTNPSPPQPSPDTIERGYMRAVWIATIYGLDWPQQPARDIAQEESQKQELRDKLDHLSRIGFNTVFLQVRHRGDVIYPSQYEPFSPVFSGNRQAMNYDPLSFAIEECHKRGLQIHAWMTTFPLGNSRVHRPPKHLPLDWCVRHRGEWQLDPGLPEVRQYIASLVSELVKLYPALDGVHMDYVRYPDFAKTFADNASYKKYGQGMSKEQWRRENISQLMGLVYRAAQSEGQKRLVSCATLGKLRRLPTYPHIGWTAYEDVYQDPVEWAKRGVVDFIVPMMYYRDEHFDPFLADWKEQLPHFPVIPGIGIYRLDEPRTSWTAELIDQQMAMVQALEMPGICFYREQNLRHSKTLETVILKHFASNQPPLLFPYEPKLKNNGQAH
ncbi:MAG: family 10 glycosylhydrolase [Porphyromonas sp.]|nr:family 10 glycosylhydrolase [Porphyromonas sp.]